MISFLISKAFRRFTVLAVAALALVGCQASSIPKHLKPIPRQLIAKMGQLGMDETADIFIRIFKESSELEVWKETADGSFALLRSYEVCRWSGELGPKRKEGDRQAPEGFYTVAPAQMNPNSSYYLSFNIGYPNTFDKSLGRTGSHLMVHGACSSAGCYSMTDEAAGEIFSLARDSFRGGQRAFHIQAFPFRMTAENLARHRNNPNMDFWRMLKVGHDNFEITKRPPKIDVCENRYVFNADAGGATFDPSGACPAYKVPPDLAAALALKQAGDNQQLAVAIAALEAEKSGQAEEALAVRLAAAAAQTRAAERAARPSLISRLLGRTSNPAPAATPVAIGAVKPVPANLKAVDVPLPRLRPTVLASAVAAPAPVAAPLAAAPPLAENGTPIVGVGTFIKRDFNWPEDDG